MKKFKDLPLDKNLEIYAKKNIPNNPDTTSTPEELKKKMLYGSAETFITRLKVSPFLQVISNLLDTSRFTTELISLIVKSFVYLDCQTLHLLREHAHLFFER